MPNQSEAVIVSACRTAIGNFMGTLSEIPPAKLAAIAIREAISRAGIEAALVDEVIMGCILTAGAGQSVGRQAGVYSGIPVTTPGYTVNKMCGSGMKAIVLGVQAILLGDANVVVAGGVESMSTAAYVLPAARKGMRLGNTELLDSMIVDGLTDAFNPIHMGITAENVAEECQITRKEQDQFACWSQNKAEAAINAGRFIEEIVPVEIPQKKGNPIIFDQDEYPRFGCTLEALSKLKPAFKSDGTVTAGNASGINDGAAVLVLMSRQRARDLGIKPMALLKCYGTGGVDPKEMGLGPIPAVRKALQKASLTCKHIDLIEANEAFAAQSLAIARELEFPEERLNVNGGAIALGHPIGASGCRIVVTLLHEMKKRNAGLGLATLCIGGGMGIATIFEQT